MSLRRIVHLVCTVSLGLSCNAQAMSFYEAYQLALANDAKLASSEARLDADKEQKSQAMAQLLPQVTASVSAKKELYQLPNNPLSFDENTNNKNLQITQAIYNRQALYGYDQAETKIDYSSLRLLSDKNQLGVRVAEAYLNVVLSQENVSLSKQQIETTEQRLKQVTAALQVGYATKVDRLGLLSELDNAKAQLTADQQQLLFSRQKLSILIGQAVPDQLPWPNFNPDNLVNQFIQGHSWLDVAKNNNLDVQLQKKAVEVAQQEVEVRASGFYPVVNLGAYYSDASGASYFAQKNDNKAIYLEMKLPLYQGGYDSARVREGKSLLRSAEFDAQYAGMDATQKAQEQLSTIRASREKLEALKQAIASGETYLASAEEGYRLGVRDSAEVSRAKEKLFANRRDQSLAKIQMLNGVIQLQAIAGQLDANAIEGISKFAW